jgi:hypothetical protein
MHRSAISSMRRIKEEMCAEPERATACGAAGRRSHLLGAHPTAALRGGLLRGGRQRGLQLPDPRGQAATFSAVEQSCGTSTTSVREESRRGRCLMSVGDNESREELKIT